MLSLKKIETEKFIFKIYEEYFYLEYIVKEGVTIDAKEVLDGKRRVTETSPGIKFYVLAEGINFFTLTAEARKITATQHYSDNTIAIAFYTTNVSIFLLGEMYNKINKPAVPTKLFTDRENAKEWLHQQMQQDGHLNFSIFNL